MNLKFEINLKRELRRKNNIKFNLPHDVELEMFQELDRFTIKILFQKKKRLMITHNHPIQQFCKRQFQLHPKLKVIINNYFKIKVSSKINYLPDYYLIQAKNEYRGPMLQYYHSSCKTII